MKILWVPLILYNILNFGEKCSLCSGLLFVCASMYSVHAVPSEVRRGHWIPWIWTYKWLQFTM